MPRYAPLTPLQGIERLVAYYRFPCMRHVSLEAAQRPYLHEDNPRLSFHALATDLLNYYKHQGPEVAYRELSGDPVLLECLLRHCIGEACRLSHTLALLDLQTV